MEEALKRMLAGLKYIVPLSLILSSYPFITAEPYSISDFAIMNGILIASFSMFFAAYIIVIMVIKPKR
ncbi:MAG: hypothetical protein HQL71_04430 [Magnetococcales bacterium]|nr:hypothetical protein [Magnetococcales bacterium]